MSRQHHGPRRSVRHWLLAAVAVLAAVPLLGSAPAGARGAERDITMLDNRFSPSVADVAQGQSTEFTNFGRVVHDAQDDRGLDVIDTGFMQSPDSVTIGPLPGAGDYRYYCTFHPEMTGRLRVPVTVSAMRSPAGAAVTVRWAVSRAPADLVFDVQRRLPGTHRFVDWRAGATAAAAMMHPVVRGPWAIRARVRRQTGEASSGWSPVATLRIT